MLVYNEIKSIFIQDVKDNKIADKIQDSIRQNHLLAGAPSEFAAWQNSMQFMRNIIDVGDIADDVNIAIEYEVPNTAKRVDFIISGADEQGHNNIIIVELKQWQKADIVAEEMTHSVRTYVGGADRIVSHPSYQAFSYASFIKNYSEKVESLDIQLHPCAYLHNYETQYRYILENEIYETWYSAAPFFIREDTEKFREFVKRYINKKSSNGDLLYEIEQGRIKPTKALQDAIVSMLNGVEEFHLLEEQVVALDVCFKTMTQCMKDQKKRTLIIKGGPGTGKSVIAINLLVKFIKNGWNTSYITKNSAPRNAFVEMLTQSGQHKKVQVEQLFKSPFGLSRVPANSYDCLIVDEAHRLVDKMYGDWEGYNQVKECINAAQFSIFFLDEDQRITTKDIGSQQQIEVFCKELGSRCICNESANLISQFRCNGSDAYIQLIDYLLQKNMVCPDLTMLKYELKIFDNPSILRDALRLKNNNNKARMVAGYCYDWNVKHHRGEWDIEIDDDFKARWNLEGDAIWAINPSSFEEVGCIHTAQGLEFDYVGVLIGKDLRYNEETGRIETHRESISRDDRSSGIRNRNTSEELAKTLILNTYKTLLTRGQQGCYIYCEDKALSNYFKSIVRNIN